MPILGNVCSYEAVFGGFAKELSTVFHDDDASTLPRFDWPSHREQGLARAPLFVVFAPQLLGLFVVTLDICHQ